MAETVYKHLFPYPRANDPQTFSHHLQRHLVNEVRLEVTHFYGEITTVEAKYPGLDYTYAPHRKRLAQFPHHARLFRAFDELGLTSSEIVGLCRWEGTLWARERYERDEGIKVVDTTGDDIAKADDPPRRTREIHVRTDFDVEIDGDDDGDDDDDDAFESVGDELNQRLRRAAAARERGQDTPMDPAWEAWLKEALESGMLRPPPPSRDPHAYPDHAFRDTIAPPLAGHGTGRPTATTTCRSRPTPSSPSSPPTAPHASKPATATTTPTTITLARPSPTRHASLARRTPRT